jgi:hypothetical protein
VRCPELTIFLQLVPDRVRDQYFQKRSQGLPRVKGTIHFPVDKLLPATMLKKMVEGENRG